MRRSVFLKYSSFLLMLTSLVRLIFGIMMINFYATANTFGAVRSDTLRAAGITLLLLVLSAGAELAGGFVGALNWEEPLRSGKCVAWGAAILGLGLAGNAMQAITGYGISYVAWLTGAVVPAVYLLAAVQFYLSYRRGKERRDV